MIDSFFPNFINDLGNSRLVSTISALHRHPGNLSVVGAFFEEFCNCSLITTSGAPIRRPEARTLLIDSNGLAEFEPGSVISLATLKSACGREILPAFTHGKALKRAGLPEELYALAVPCSQLIEMFLASRATVLAVNFGNPESIELERFTIEELAAQLRELKRLDDRPCVTAVGGSCSSQLGNRQIEGAADCAVPGAAESSNRL